MTRAQDFPEAAHAKPCSARKGEGQQRKLQPDKIGRREENGLLLLLPLVPPSGIIREPSLRPAPRVCPSLALGSVPRVPDAASATRRGAVGGATWGLRSGKPRDQLRPAGAGLCVPSTAGLGVWERRLSRILYLAARGGRRTLRAKGPHPRGICVCKKVTIK